MAPSSPRLDSLSFDILLRICRFVEHDPKEDEEYPCILEPHPLRPLSLVSKVLRDICAPLLFQRIIVKIPACKEKNMAWCATYDTLKEMDESPLLGSRVRSFHLLIEGDARDAAGWDSTRRPSKMLPRLLAKVLTGMTRLEEFAIKLPTSQSDFFKEEFAEFGLTLPFVHKIYTGRLCGFMIYLCPNLDITHSLYDSDWEVYRSHPKKVKGWFRAKSMTKGHKNAVLAESSSVSLNKGASAGTDRHGSWPADEPKAQVVRTPKLTGPEKSQDAMENLHSGA